MCGKYFKNFFNNRTHEEAPKNCAKQPFLPGHLQAATQPAIFLNWLNLLLLWCFCIWILRSLFLLVQQVHWSQQILFSVTFVMSNISEFSILSSWLSELLLDYWSSFLSSDSMLLSLSLLLFPSSLSESSSSISSSMSNKFGTMKVSSFDNHFSFFNLSFKGPTAEIIYLPAVLEQFSHIWALQIISHYDHKIRQGRAGQGIFPSQFFLTKALQSSCWRSDLSSNTERNTAWKD